MGGRGKLLRPGLHGKSHRRTENAGDQDRGNRRCRGPEMRMFKQGRAYGHENGRGADLENGDLLEREALAGASYKDDVKGKAESAAYGKEIAKVDVGEVRQSRPAAR